MLLMYHRNAILTGSVDSFCLVCESHLRSAEDADNHIEKPVHKKKLSLFPYMEKFSDDHIRKVKNGYFCEFCNILLPTAAKVGLHIAEETHKEKKKPEHIKRVAKKIVLLDNLLISEQAWNGIIEDTCAICNMEFHNLKLHITDQNHILNLIQKKVEFGDGHTAYRKIDDASFHCLICNSIFALNTVAEHNSDEIHMAHVSVCRKCYQTSFENKETAEKAEIKKDSILNDLEANKNNSQKLVEKEIKGNNQSNCQAPNKIEVKEGGDHHDIKVQTNENSQSVAKKEIKDGKVNDVQAQADYNNFQKADNKEIKKDGKVNGLKNKDSLKNPYTHEEAVEKKSDEDLKVKKANQKLANKDSGSNTNNKATITPQSTTKDKNTSQTQTENLVSKSNEAVFKESANKMKFEDDIKDEKQKLATTTNKNSGSNTNNKATITPQSTTKDKKTSQTQTENLVSKSNEAVLKESANKIKFEDDDKDKIFEHVSEFQKNGVNINFENDTAFCKKCFESVHLDIKEIRKHIEEHKNRPNIEVTANTVHTINDNHSRTVLNSKDKVDDVACKPSVNFDQNHNLTKIPTEKESKNDEGDEIIKIDLTKKSDEDTNETEANLTVARYVPGASATTLKPEETANKSTTKPVIDTNDPATFAKEHKLTYNKGNNNAYCRICKTRVPASIKNMKEHVGGTSHKNKVGRIAATERAESIPPTKPMEKFIHQTSTVMNVLGIDDVILNDKFCLTRMSFYMITTHKRMRCQACEVNVNENEVSRHVDEAFHERAMEKTPVVTSLPTEFVREVRPGLFHCGFCNLMVGPWEDVTHHLQCSEHAVFKRKAKARLDEHLPGILQHRATRDEVFARAFLHHFWPLF